MTDLESPRKNNDCYFYYYSTCAKGDNCTFRHEPSALGCETMCSFWKEGKCLNVHCNFRHMELRKNRKAIQCYWEAQPGGCLKPHCPFLHQTVKASDYNDSNIETRTDSSQSTMKNDLGHSSDKSFKNPVDSLVVNFEEESDNESTLSFSPTKNQKNVKVKTLEEIKLEKIQEESAAYFSYTGDVQIAQDIEDDLRNRLLNKKRNRERSPSDNLSKKKKLNNDVVDHNMSLDEHILSKKKTNYTINDDNKEISTIKIKTLEEIRAERLKKQLINLTYKDIKRISENIVTSTTNKEDKDDKPVRKKLKLRRLTSEIDADDNKEEKIRNDAVLSVDQNKLNEELLLDDDDDDTNMTLRAEDELLDEIDDLLSK